ncbi:Uncharacterized conserved protein [Rhizobium sp. RU20A]|uniref:COG4223 family protein n=1 Tax=Rhizobium sp. RU20A TaxID=1907412 RepID=UPI000955A84F|nr:COG4223 family protein [Rhizobium sp. RU20A]SIQ90183.1 Uncharacterized conserved protein [Rhizobium sp. RU20A]
MASKPPSRRKPGESNEQPTTIDLSADPVVKADVDTDGGKDAGEPALTAPEKPQADPLSTQAMPEQAEASTATLESSRVEDAPTTAADVADTPSDRPRDAAADAAAAFGEEPSPARAETATPTSGPAATHKPSGTSTSGALAAGILGGLVVLVAAGGLQYAGVLPSLAPREADSEALTALQAEVESLKSANQGAPADLAPVEQRLAALEQKTTETQSVDLAPLNQQLADLSAAVASLQASTGSADSARSDLTTRLDTIEKKLAEPTAETRLARAVAVTALKTAIDRGGPYLAELDAFKSVAPDDPAIAPLSEDAQGGVATRADLIDAFPAVADAMLDAVRQRDPNQGVFGRLLDSAASAVRIRPVGDVAGDGPDAAVARIERALTNGDLKAAALEWDTLPEAAKTAGADFRRKLDRRIAVEAAIDSAVAAPVTTSNQG